VHRSVISDQMARGFNCF